MLLVTLVTLVLYVIGISHWPQNIGMGEVYSIRDPLVPCSFPVLPPMTINLSYGYGKEEKTFFLFFSFLVMLPLGFSEIMERMNVS